MAFYLLTFNRFNGRNQNSNQPGSQIEQSERLSIQFCPNMSENTEPEQYDSEEVKELYDDFHESDDFIKFPLADSRFISGLVRRYDIGPQTSVLSVACGTGKYGRTSAKVGPRSRQSISVELQ